MPDISDAISNYVRAKDGNRPWLMRRAFVKGAFLEMVVETDAISFPSTAAGIDAITEILVRRFSCENENVYTVCLSSPPIGYDQLFTCNWLVGMSRRGNGEVRVGWGRYDWSFSNRDEMRADSLKITIEAMQIVAPDHLQSVMSWLAELPYPWCSPKAAIRKLPRMNELTPVLEFLRRTSL